VTPSPVADRAPTPPGPPGIVPLAEIRDDPLGFLERTVQTHGDFTAHRTEAWQVFLVNRPDLARRLLRELRSSLSKLGTPDDQMLAPLLGRGLLTSEGEQWKRQRTLAQPAFTPRRIETFDADMVRAATDLLARWRPAVEAGTPVRLDHDLTGLALTVVARALLGADMSGVGGRFGESVDTVNRVMGHYEPLADTPDGRRARVEFGRAIAFLDQIVRLLVEGRRVSRVQADDLLGRLLDAADEEGGFTPTELRDQVLTMIMAGHETTAKALTWTLYLLDRHRDVGDALRAQLRDVLGDRLPTTADLERLPLCRQVILEAMRLYPPVWLISRRTTQPVELDGYTVPAESLVCVSPYLLHRHPDHWEDPERYDPARFAPEREAARHPFAYIPFSEGPRKCIGHAFALTEAQLVLATLWARLDVRVVPDHPVSPEALVTLRPRHGLLATLHEVA
jgi:enediyne biosynthesis protein E7